MTRPNPSQGYSPNERLRLYVALILIIAYVLLVVLLPWVPSVREPLSFLGPFVGAVIGYAFGNYRGQL